MFDDDLKSVLEGTYGEMGLEPVKRLLDANQQPLNPILPIDITAISSEALGRLYGQFSANMQWAKEVQAFHTVEVILARKYDKLMRASVRSSLPKALTIQQKEDLSEIDPKVVETSRELSVAEGKLAIAEAILLTYQNGAICLSREMSRRSGREK